jgi:hypothetical protein
LNRLFGRTTLAVVLMHTRITTEFSCLQKASRSWPDRDAAAYGSGLKAGTTAL